MRAVLLLICGFVYVIPFYFHYSSHEFDGFEVIFTWLDNGVYRCISVINTRWRTQEEKIKFSYKNPECYVFSFSVFISVFGLATFKLWAEYFVYTTYRTVERQLNRTNERKQEYLQRNILRVVECWVDLFSINDTRFERHKVAFLLTEYTIVTVRCFFLCYLCFHSCLCFCSASNGNFHQPQCKEPKSNNTKKGVTHMLFAFFV